MDVTIDEIMHVLYLSRAVRFLRIQGAVSFRRAEVSVVGKEKRCNLHRREQLSAGIVS